MISERDERFSRLIRDLASCGQEANQLGLEFLGHLINMAVMETALEWDGGRIVPLEPAMRLEQLLNLKIRTALGMAGGNVVMLARDRDHA
jgi:hypothetical protein